MVKASIGLEGRDVDASPTRASTGLSTRARFEPTAEDAEDAFHFDGAQSRSPFGRASDFPPSYDETKLMEAETSSGATGEDEEPALEQLREARFRSADGCTRGTRREARSARIYVIDRWNVWTCIETCRRSSDASVATRVWLWR